jgi:Domain of unknown function (DUF4260)
MEQKMQNQTQSTSLPVSILSGAAGVVTGTPKQLLRLEGAALLAAAITAYALLGGNWWLFAILFLAPDIAMIPYVFGTKAGAVFYNAAHTTILPLGLGIFATSTASELPQLLALIWLAHIGFDRLIGYGLKYGDHFKHTHLGTPFEHNAKPG